MKLFMNMVLVVAAFLLALVLVGQGYRLYQQNQAEVHKAAQVAGQYAEKAKEVVIDSVKAVGEAAGQ